MQSKFTMFGNREKKVFNEKKAIQLLLAMLGSSRFWMETNIILESGINILSRLPKNSEEEISDFKLTYICLLICVGMHHDKELTIRNYDITANHLLSRRYPDKTLENIWGPKQIENLDDANNDERTPLLTDY